MFNERRTKIILEYHFRGKKIQIDPIQSIFTDLSLNLRPFLMTHTAYEDSTRGIM
jgi:hypothetical protein